MRPALPVMFSFVTAACSATPASAPPAEAGPTSAAPVAAAPANVAAYETLVGAADRLPDDKALDAGRKPAAFLQFAAVSEGMRVGELMAGTGYSTELLARAVGPNGVVFAQNSKGILDKFAAKPWAARLARPAMKNVVRVDRELDSPFPPEATNLDKVVMVIFYHDAVWLHVDCAAMNKAVFAALKPGGEYIIVDHSASAGRGTQDAQTLHRIEDATVQKEVEAAGFKLAGTADILRNAQDARDWNPSPSAAGARRGTSDRFVLKFVRPAS